MVIRLVQERDVEVDSVSILALQVGDQFTSAGGIVWTVSAMTIERERIELEINSNTYRITYGLPPNATMRALFLDEYDRKQGQTVIK